MSYKCLLAQHQHPEGRSAMHLQGVVNQKQVLKGTTDQRNKDLFLLLHPGQLDQHDPKAMRKRET